MIQTLAAEAEVLEYATHDNTKPSLTLRGRWEALFLPTPRTQFGIGADVSNGRLNALTARNSPDQTVIVATPTGSAEVRQATAQQSLSWQATQATHTVEQSFLRWAATNDDLAMPTTTNSLEAGVGVGFDRAFEANNFGLEVGGSYLRLERISAVGSGTPSRLDRQLNPHATATWRHDYSKQWSSALNAGIVYVNPIGVDPYSPTIVQQRAQPSPVFGAMAAYTELWGGVQLTVERAVAANLFLAQNTVNESVHARISLPLHFLTSTSRALEAPWTALGAVGVSRSRLVDAVTADLQGEFQIAHADVALQWRPRPSATYTLRYEFVYQHGDTIAAMVSPSYFRNTVFLEFAFRYPELVATQVPRHGSVRADGGDLAPVGAEPVVPDATAPAE